MPGGVQRIYRQKIKSTQSLMQVFRAQELIAGSRIGRARDRNTAAGPYAQAITRAVAAVAAHSDIDHPLTHLREDTNRVAVLLLASDRGMAGAYTAGVLRETERLLQQLEAVGRRPLLYVAGRRAVAYFHYRDRELSGEWIYGSDKPTAEDAGQIAETLLAAFVAPPDQGGVAELHVVYTQFNNMVSQTPRVVRMLPLEVVEGESEPGHVEPLYEFEPSAEEVLDALLPRYVRARIYSFMLESAASEVASRQRSMHTATENAKGLVDKYTRLANQARQDDITQEISEIVSGADALAQS